MIQNDLCCARPLGMRSWVWYYHRFKLLVLIDDKKIFFFPMKKWPINNTATNFMTFIYWYCFIYFLQPHYKDLFGSLQKKWMCFYKKGYIINVPVSLFISIWPTFCPDLPSTLISENSVKGTVQGAPWVKQGSCITAVTINEIYQASNGLMSPKNHTPKDLAGTVGITEEKNDDHNAVPFINFSDSAPVSTRQMCLLNNVKAKHCCVVCDGNLVPSVMPKVVIKIFLFSTFFKAHLHPTPDHRCLSSVASTRVRYLRRACNHEAGDERKSGFLPT